MAPTTKPSFIGPALLAGLIPFLIQADSPDGGEAFSGPPETSPSQELSDLSLGNLFTAGWNEPWEKRPHPAGAPDLTLLRVQSNLLLRSLRTDYFYERSNEASEDQNVQLVSELVEYSWNRRLMLAALGNYEWINRREGEGQAGGVYGGLARLQLIDQLNTSYAFNLRVTAPRDGTGEEQPLMSFAVAGWHDLTPLGLPRVGLYWHLQEESLLGGNSGGKRQNDLTYDLSFAKTWTGPNDRFGNLSTFFETYAKTDLDGPHPGHSVVTLTPGIRFNVHHHHVLMFGVEMPVTSPQPYRQIIRFTYIFSI